MRYVRFLKTPRIVDDNKSASRPHVLCLATITSDLGDTFLPCDVQLSAELLACDVHGNEKLLVWSYVQWTGGMRSLPITLPLPKSGASISLRLKVGLTPKSTCDDYQSLADQHATSVVSAWSAPFNRSTEAPRLAERRFQLASGTLNVWEETGNSIARHLWDAGIVLSCHLDRLLSKESEMAQVLFPGRTRSALQVMELGTGCGIVGISLAQNLEDIAVVVTDLAEASDIVQRNLSQVKTAARSCIQFQKLDWHEAIPVNLNATAITFDLVLAADCTYNADSSPAFVDTISRIVHKSPSTVVAIAMKMRHPSEVVFFELMATAAFIKVSTISYPLPGDTEDAEETVDLHVYRYEGTI
ncbi:hypothetical protein T440DRAFT_514498 [Plenodomus tracheiphilus IPT5]|uniref:Methyltransferase-domain-containing protein n=1 Tax=Plenodomus tracheiphilus IPT5 TaxID=1408161 RepID=A0A6A7BGM3_9PLEO|nr:hypothetical protein T440DRAFT_514498 [Plenodomus tracheiphilus IPT5]